jgi:hypothetical protein
MFSYMNLARENTVEKESSSIREKATYRLCVLKSMTAGNYWLTPRTIRHFLIWDMNQKWQMNLVL